MARTFVSASSQYLNAATAAFTAQPFTMSAWAVTTTTTGERCIVQIENSGNTTDRHNMVISGTGAFTVSGNSSTNNNSFLNSVVTTGAWHHYAAVHSSASSRYIWFNGTRGTQGTTSITSSGLNSTSIGMERDSTPAAAWDGQIAEVAIWNVALADNEVVALSKRVSPLRVRRDALVHYWPIWGLDSPEIPAVRGSFTVALNGGTPARANHAPVELFSRMVRSTYLEPPVASSSLRGSLYYYYRPQ